MKFIVMLEEDGYQVRFWNELDESIGVSIATNWNKKVLHEMLLDRGFQISRKTLYRAIEELDENKHFVILKSEFKNSSDLDTFMNDMFKIEE